VHFSFRQIMASTAGAVVAAIIASTFGVKGTIVGVAIGSAAATMATAFVAQSIERGHEAVKQVVVKAPDTGMLLRRLGGTGASGDTLASASSAPTEVVRSSPPEEAGAAPETVQMASTAAPAGATERVEISAVTDAPATERLRATTGPAPPPVIARRAPTCRFSWQAIAASAVVVFVLALLLITAVELISGKPLSNIFGGADTGTSLGNVVTPTTTSSTTPVTTTSTTSTPTSSTTTTTSTGATSTTTTAPTGESSTTTTTPAPSNTTTTVVTGSASTTPSTP
jgi:hypothetical protein